MATTEVLLLKYMKGLGAEGESVKVRSGYARNFLFPNELALPLTQANKNQIAALERARAKREEQELESANALAEQLKYAVIAIVVKTGENGKMFGAVTAKEIAEKLAADGIVIERKKIHLDAPIKEVGHHKVAIHLHETIVLELPLDVVSENPIK